MKPEIKRRWLEALRSGKYKQGKGQLRKCDEFCCLGVLCDIAREDGIGHWSSEDFACHHSSSVAALPRNVLKWAELQRVDPPLGESSCATANDQGKSFAEIADLIEKYL